MAINSEVYVDKIEMMVILNSFLNTNKRYVSVSRPRRFGKTMSADMIWAYYDRSANSRILFESTKLAKSGPVRTGRGELAWDGFLGKFDVVRLVMTDFFKMGKSVDSGLALLSKRLLGERFIEAVCFGTNLLHGFGIDPDHFPRSPYGRDNRAS